MNATVSPKSNSSPKEGYGMEAKVSYKCVTTKGMQGNAKESSSLGTFYIQSPLNSNNSKFKPRIPSPSEYDYCIHKYIGLLNLVPLPGHQVATGSRHAVSLMPSWTARP